MSEHTKTPWKREIGNECHIISGPDRRPIGTIHNPDDGTHIVTCVNGFDELVRALEYCAYAPGELAPSNQSQFLVARKALDKIREKG